MTLEEKILDITKDIDPGKPVFSVNVSKTSIRIREESWRPAGPGDGANYLQKSVFRNLSRSFIKDENRYDINNRNIINSIKRDAAYRSIRVFELVSPAKAPRRTKVYKSFSSLVRSDYDNNSELYSSLADIIDYYEKQTENSRITDEANAIARTNIYQLLCLMEKKYGKTRKKTSY